MVRIATTKIFICPLGGFVTSSLTLRWRKQLVIAIGGPAVNFLFAPTFVLIGYMTHSTNALHLLQHLFVINAVMLVFNLLPIWPLDGGRILAAILQAFLGIIRGRLAAHVAGIALAALAAPLLLYIHVEDAGSILLLMILANVFGMRWPLGMLARERRYGFHDVARCPHCRSRALIAPTGDCSTCGTPCNLLDNGTCWNCHASSPILCPYCRESADFAAWMSETYASMQVLHKGVPAAQERQGGGCERDSLA
jgi:hypothetical protein